MGPYGEKLARNYPNRTKTWTSTSPMSYSKQTVKRKKCAKRRKLTLKLQNRSSKPKKVAKFRSGGAHDVSNHTFLGRKIPKLKPKKVKTFAKSTLLGCSWAQKAQKAHENQKNVRNKRDSYRSRVQKGQKTSEKSLIWPEFLFFGSFFLFITHFNGFF